ncbi:MAG: tyrosinase family protein [Massilia sp.]
MKPQEQKRRDFLRQSMLAVGAATLPIGLASAQVPAYRRLEWQSFKTTSQYSSLRFAISKMIANTNSADPNSWSYWVNGHVNYCPHGISYFLAWHRGFLYYFERQLRAISGDNTLVLPYWDYYLNPVIPTEFTSPTVGNPLWTSRVNTNVRAALTLAPFSSSLINFPRYWSNAFEPSIENAPHNPVHDIIGGWMTTMKSPVDPVFWLHHANIDRLWVAWLAAGGGRNMPLRTSSYWSGSFRYSSTLTMSRLLTYDNRSSLNYFYQVETMPSRLPSLASGPALMETRPADGQPLLSPPAVGSYPLSPPRATSNSTFAAAGSLGIALDERSVSVQLPLAAEAGQAVAQIARGNATVVPGGTVQYRSVHLVLDEIEMTESGRNGGYFYQLYLNVPAGQPGAAQVESKLVGTLGPFRIAAAEHHHGSPSQLRYVVTDLLAGLSRTQMGMLTMSFVRVSGENSPSGQVIVIGEARLELSSDSGRS